MKEILTQYAAFNVWATQRITDVIVQLPEEKIQAEIVSSFPTMYKTVLHLLDAESIWPGCCEAEKSCKQKDAADSHSFEHGFSRVSPRPASCRIQEFGRACAPLLLGARE